MKITLTPQYSSATLTLEKQGETLIINGTPYDLSGVIETSLFWEQNPYSDGQGVEANIPMVTLLERNDGELHVRVILPYTPPAPFDVMHNYVLTDVPDGVVTLPG